MPDPIELVVWPLVLACAVALGVVLASWPLWGRRALRGAWVNPLAAGAAILTPFRLITGAWPTFPPNTALGWLFYLTIPATLAASLAVAAGLPRWARLLMTCLIAGMIFTFVFWNPLRNAQATATVVTLILSGVVAAGVWWWVLEPSAPGDERITTLLAMLLLTSFSAGLMMMSASIVYGRLGLACAGASLGMLIAGLIFRKMPIDGFVMVLTVVLGGLLLAANYFAELTMTNLALIGLAPLAMSTRRLIPPLRRSGWKGSLGGLSLLLLPLMIAMIITVPRFVASLKVDESGYGY